MPTYKISKKYNRLAHLEIVFQRDRLSQEFVYFLILIRSLRCNKLKENRLSQKFMYFLVLIRSLRCNKLKV